MLGNIPKTRFVDNFEHGLCYDAGLKMTKRPHKIDTNGNEIAHIYYSSNDLVDKLQLVKMGFILRSRLATLQKSIFL